jgi:ACT domain-containing protein
MKNITTELVQHNIEILKVTEIVQTEIINIILLGHVFETDFVDTFKRISKTGAKIVRIEALFTDPKDISNVNFEIHVNKQYIKKNDGRNPSNLPRKKIVQYSGTTKTVLLKEEL